jgi:hypothetical protein
MLRQLQFSDEAAHLNEVDVVKFQREDLTSLLGTTAIDIARNFQGATKRSCRTAIARMRKISGLRRMVPGAGVTQLNAINDLAPGSPFFLPTATLGFIWANGAPGLRGYRACLPSTNVTRPICYSRRFTR